MVVDDEEFCIAAMKTMLQIVGIDIMFTVDFCINGKEALDKIQDSYRNGLRYKMIFTDFSMPVLDGIQSTYQIREFLTEEMEIKREDQPVILGVTGHV